MKSCMKFTHMNRGFTLIETLFSLIALSFCTLLLIPILQITLSITHLFEQNEDLLGVYQLRYILAQSTDFQLEPSTLSFRYHQEAWTLSYHNENIVKEPGYEIFLMHVKDAEFLQKESCYYLRYKNERELDHEVLLSCE